MRRRAKLKIIVFMFDIITFGSASRDIFLESKKVKSVEKKTFITKEGIYLSLGSKIDINNIYYFTGGGGTNTTATFSNMALKTAFYGSLGLDEAGEDVIKELKENKIDTSLVKILKDKKTNQSIVLNVKDKDRTILVYRGASEYLETKNFKLPKTKWIYIAPLSGKASNYFSSIISYAKKEKIKIAVNLGNSQLKLKNIENILKEIDILILNQEEASILSKVDSFKKEKEVIKKLISFYSGVLVITKGPSGVDVINDNYIYSASILPAKVIDRTGAGDAFGAGFVSEYILSSDIIKSIQFGTANSASILPFWGAKTGLLKKGQSFKKVKVEKSILL